MKINNLLPSFVAAMERWSKPPTPAGLLEHYLLPAQPMLDVILAPREADEIARDLARMPDWQEYRASVLRLDPIREQARLNKHLRDVESLFGVKLGGEVNLFGAFKYMDGYARFDRGTHRVFLGIDENFANGAYIDVLMAHELSHVARESQPTVWEGFGLDPRMTQDQFTEHQPVIEHLMGEGLSCLASEIIVPGQSPWLYAYQEKAGYARVLTRAARVDEIVKEEILHPAGDYGRLYRAHRYGKDMPGLTHYVWAWQWARQVAQDLANGDFHRLVRWCSKDFIEHALAFNLVDVGSGPKTGRIGKPARAKRG